MGVREEVLSLSIRSRLEDDKRVSDMPVSPHVIGDVVYLIGYVNTLEERDIVEFIVRGTPGVTRVNTDELDIREVVQA